MTAEPAPQTKRRLPAIIAGGLAGVVLGLGAVYGIGTFQGKLADAACRPAAELAQRLAPLARGEVAAIAVATDPRRLPDLAFIDASGKARRLSEWQGRTV